jgi:hypothetical protein
MHMSEGTLKLAREGDVQDADRRHQRTGKKRKVTSSNRSGIMTRPDHFSGSKC